MFAESPNRIFIAQRGETRLPDPVPPQFAGFAGSIGIKIDLRPQRFVKLDFQGNRLYTWNVPPDLPDGYLEVQTFSVDSDGNLYGDNQYGRTQKFVPNKGTDPNLLIRPPWVAR